MSGKGNPKRSSGSSRPKRSKTASAPRPSSGKKGKNSKGGGKGVFITALCLVIFAVMLLIGKPMTMTEIQDMLGVGDSIAADTAGGSSFDFAVHYLDVGQGDSELIIAGGCSVLIDAGEREYGTAVLKAIKDLGVEKLDYIIATHPHSDHIGGMAEVIENMDVGKMIVPKVPSELTPTSAAYERMLKAVKKKGLKLTQAKAGDTYTVGNAEMTILGPIGSNYEDLNDFSVVCKVTYKDTSFLFTGDASFPSEDDMTASGEDLSADVLKVGHHGSTTSSGRGILAAVQPSVCVISCGAGNSYGHPHEKALNRIRKYTDKIYRTDLDGAISIFSDGSKLYIRTANGSDNE